MFRIKIQKVLFILMIAAGMANTLSAQSNNQGKKESTIWQKKDAVRYKVTFIELGSVKCIPCQKMQAVMKAVEEKYGSQVRVVFYDVWTPEGKPFCEKYGIEQIPTQVFLDENGKEFSRHVGYFPEEELVAVLKTKGVK